MHDKLQLVTFEYLKQFIQLVYIIKDSLMSVCSRYAHLFHRVLCQHFHFYCIGKSRMQSKVILLDCTSLNALVHFMVEVSLDMCMVQVGKRHIRIMNSHVFYKTLCISLVALECGSGRIRLDRSEPIGKETVKFIINDDVFITFGVTIVLAVDTEHDLIIVPLLCKLSYDLLDSFVERFLGAFLRQSR